MNHTYNIEQKFGIVGGIVIAVLKPILTLINLILAGHYMSAIGQSFEVLWLGGVGALGTVIGTHIAKLFLRWATAKLNKLRRK